MVSHESILQARNYLEVYHHAIIGDNRPRARVAAELYRNLLRELNGGSLVGIFAEERSPGVLLRRALAADNGQIPMWGQMGDFVVVHAGIKVRVTYDATVEPLDFSCGLALHALDPYEPFISETGFRSLVVQPWAMTIDAAVKREIDTLLKSDKCMVAP